MADAPTVYTGCVMMVLTGASLEALTATTLSRRSTSVTMPSPSRVVTRRAEASSSAMSSAASAIVVSGSQNTGARRTSEPTVRKRTSGSERMVRAACSRRSRRVWATKRTPSGRLRISSATSPWMTNSAESSRARVVNSGASPVSSVGWPNTSPRLTTSTMTSLCVSSRVPSSTMYSWVPGSPPSTNTASPAGTKRSVMAPATRSRVCLSRLEKGSSRARKRAFWARREALSMSGK